MRLALPAALLLAAAARANPLPVSTAAAPGDGIVVRAPGAISGGELSVQGPAGVSATAELRRSNAFAGLRDVFELRNLPADWAKVSFAPRASAGQPVVLLRRGEAPAPVDASKALSGFSRTVALAVVIPCALWGVLMVGVTGGPNHGEHPFLMSLILYAWLFVLDWHQEYFAGIAASAAAAMAISVAVLPKRGLLPFHRAALAAAYVAAVVLVVRSPGLRAAARWDGAGAVELDLRADLRGDVTFLDARGGALSTAILPPGPGVPALFFWSGTTAPASVRVAPPGRAAFELRLGSRP